MHLGPRSIVYATLRAFWFENSQMLIRIAIRAFWQSKCCKGNVRLGGPCPPNVARVMFWEVHAPQTWHKIFQLAYTFGVRGGSKARNVTHLELRHSRCMTRYVYKHFVLAALQSVAYATFEGTGARVKKKLENQKVKEVKKVQHLLQNRPTWSENIEFLTWKFSWQQTWTETREIPQGHCIHETFHRKCSHIVQNIFLVDRVQLNKHIPSHM